MLNKKRVNFPFKMYAVAALAMDMKSPLSWVFWESLLTFIKLFGLSGGCLHLILQGSFMDVFKSFWHHWL